ncbi:MAG: hypothetical protein ACJA2D_000573 [Pseudohongiellaceae bacterium]|jgi:hypothetical protein
MKLPFKPLAKRIMLINFDGMSVHTMDGERLTNIARFGDDDAGFDNFRFYLSGNRKTATTILVDSVAEDFVVEQIAHANAIDRRTLLKRKTDQHFRGTEYRSARILGRIEGGRRDDRVLFSALTKSQGIDPWIEILLDEEIPIQSITTPAYALCKVAKEYGLLTSDTILLVNWEQSGIRQTLIQNDRVMFSRLTPLPMNPNVQAAQIIVDSCRQSKEYLEHIGLVELDSKLDVHIITPHLDAGDFAEYNSEGGFNGIVHHNSIEMMQIGKFGGAQKEITAVMLCLDWGIRTGELKNIYAPSAALRFYHMKQTKRLMAAFSVIAVTIGILLSIPVMYNSFDRTATIARVSAETQAAEEDYDALTADFPETPIPSDAMELAVKAFGQISEEIRSPTRILTEVGQVLVNHPAVELTSIDWNLISANEDIDFTDAILAGNLVIDLKLYGVLVETRDVQESSKRLNALIDALSSLPGVSVSTISLPIETRTDTEIVTVLDGESVNAEFALSIRRET